MTTDEVIDRALAEGLSKAQITAVIDRWIEANLFRVANGYPPMRLEDAMPRYVDDAP